MTSAMVLAAGLGTRLAPLTDELPKPLMPVGDRPALAHVVDRLRAAGLARVVVNTHHRAADFPADLARFGIEAAESHEPEILGTAGGVANASHLLGEGEVLVWNGDVLAWDLDARALLDAHRASGAVATWVVAPRAAGEGTVGLDRTGAVARLRGQVFGEEVGGADFLGVHVVDPRWRARLPRSGCFVADVALPWLREGGRIATWAYAGAWIDIGTPRALLDANLAWLARRGLGRWVAESARVAESVRLGRAVVSAGAVVEGAGEVDAVVVLPGGVARAPLASAIAGANAVVAAA